MSRIDPRVFEPNFAMQPELPPAADLLAEEQPMETSLPEDDAFASYQPPDPAPPPQVPTYGPRVREPQETLQINRRPTASAAGSSGGSFCELYKDGDDWFVSGGAVRVSDTKTFNVSPYAVSVATDYEKLLYMELNVEVNRDDNGDYFMQGIIGSSTTTLEIDDIAVSPTYPSGTAPVLATGLGVAVLAVGSIKVVDGVPKFDPTGCGTFILEHCGGNITHRPR